MRIDAACERDPRRRVCFRTDIATWDAVGNLAEISTSLTTAGTNLSFFSNDSPKTWNDQATRGSEGLRKPTKLQNK